MTQKTTNLIKKLLPKWEKARSLQNRDAATKRKNNYDSTFDTVNGTFSWNNSTLVLLANFIEGEGYEEYGSIVGLSKDGKLMWEYQSHCSCNDFGDSTCAGTELEHSHVLEKKKFELNSFPTDWEEKIQDSIEKLLNALKKVESKKE